MKQTGYAVFVAALCVAGCVSAPQAGDETQADSVPETGAKIVDPSLTACLGEEQIALVGQTETDARALLPELSRIIPTNSMVTQDYRPNRVNADLDENGIVVRVWCG